MKSSAKKINLTSVDDLFSTQETRIEDNKEKVTEIEVSELYPFKNHPFKIKDDESMDKTVESIKQFGVLSPIIARPRKEGGYELVSGHRRHRASQIAGLDTVPVILRDLSDDEATIIMVDSNLQREEILPSERAFAYRMKIEAVKSQGKRTDLTSGQVGQKLNARTKLAKETGESEKQIHRFIRLTYLVPELLEMVDSKIIAFNPAVELSHLKQDEQSILLDVMEAEQSTPSLSQAQRLKKFSKDGNCDFNVMSAIMSEDKKGDLDRVTIKSDTLKKYFPKSYTPQKMEETIIRLLETWHKKRVQSQER